MIPAKATLTNSQEIVIGSLRYVWDSECMKFAVYEEVKFIEWQSYDYVVRNNPDEVEPESETEENKYKGFQVLSTSKPNRILW